MYFSLEFGCFKVDLKDKYSGPEKLEYSSTKDFRQVSIIISALGAFIIEIS
jgi:hypothetical protein